jgi:dynein heavy chain
MSVQTMMGSKHVVEIRDEVEVWEKRLGYISDVIDEWLVFQRTWMYLENIFNSEDIQKQLPAESKQFMQVDKFWKDHMQRCKKQPLVTDVCSSAVLLNRFQTNNAQLDEIQKCLESYLETKRGAFPRFYFLSNDELLEILSQTRNAQAVQPHLGKCFDNVVRVEFTKVKNSDEILGMISSEKEYVEWSEPVYARNNVEFWLGNIEAMMRRTLFDIAVKLKESYPEDGSERDDWLFSPGACAQCIIVVDQTMWTAGVTQAIHDIEKGKNKAALEEFLDFSNK